MRPPVPSATAILARRTAKHMDWIPYLFAVPLLAACIFAAQWILSVEESALGLEVVSGYRMPGALLVKAAGAGEAEPSGN